MLLPRDFDGSEIHGEYPHCCVIPRFVIGVGVGVLSDLLRIDSVTNTYLAHWRTGPGTFYRQDGVTQIYGENTTIPIHAVNEAYFRFAYALEHASLVEPFLELAARGLGSVNAVWRPLVVSLPFTDGQQVTRYVMGQEGDTKHPLVGMVPWGFYLTNCPEFGRFINYTPLTFETCRHSAIQMTSKDGCASVFAEKMCHF